MAKSIKKPGKRPSKEQQRAGIQRVIDSSERNVEIYKKRIGALRQQALQNTEPGEARNKIYERMMRNEQFLVDETKAIADLKKALAECD